MKISDVFYLRSIEPPVGPPDVLAMAEGAGGCFNLYKVEWLKSFLSRDGSRMLCWYQSPDAESARLALRQLGSDMNAVWPGITTPEDFEQALQLDDANVLVELYFDEPVERNLANALASSSSLPDADITWIAGIQSTDELKLICLFKATDAQSVRLAFEQLELPLAAVWECSTLTPVLN